MINELQKGDILYAKGNYGITRKHFVERVTPTQAIFDGIKIPREIPSWGYVKQIGGDKWDNTNYYPATPELDLEWRKILAVQKVDKINWKFKDITLEQLEAVLKIMQP